MILEYNEGCVNHGAIYIDNEPLYDIPLSTKKEILLGLINDQDSFIDDILYDTIQNICIKYGEYEDLGHCECCGDYCERYTFEV